MWRFIAVLSALCAIAITIIVVAQDVSCVEFWQSAIDKAAKDSPQMDYLVAQLESCEDAAHTPTPIPTWTPRPTSTPRPTATPKPPKIIAEGTIIGDINVNVRSCASTSCESMTRIAPGETVHIISESDGWFEIQLQPGGDLYFIASFLVKPEYCWSSIPSSRSTRGSIRFPHQFCTHAPVDEHLFMAVTEFEYIEGNVWRGRWYYSPAAGHQYLRVGVSLWCDQNANDVCETGRGYKFSVVGDGWVSEYQGDVNDYQDFSPLSPGGAGYREMIFHVKQGERDLLLRYDPIKYGYDVQFFDIFPEGIF